MTTNLEKFITTGAIPFVKMEGCGNDFILVNAEELPKETDINNLAKKICNRNFGIGADGLILILPSEKADFRMQIINSDGSEPEMCGNGIRCFAKYLHISGKTDKTKLEVETLAGIIRPELIEVDGKIQVRVDIV